MQLVMIFTTNMIFTSNMIKTDIYHSKSMQLVMILQGLHSEFFVNNIRRRSGATPLLPWL